MSAMSLTWKNPNRLLRAASCRIWHSPHPAHTPGHVAVGISSGNDSVLHIADALILLLEQPAWRPGVDLAQDQAAETRRHLLDRAAADRTKVIAFHFFFQSLGRVFSRSTRGWQSEPAS